MAEELSQESTLQEVEVLPTSNGANGKGRPELVNKVKTDEVEQSKMVDQPDASTQQDAYDGIQVCRVCQCADPEKAGEAALKSLAVCSPPCASLMKTTGQIQCLKGEQGTKATLKTPDVSQLNFSKFKCEDNLEEVPHLNDSLIKLGCACRSDLSLAHYACALRWFVSRESLVCEICGVLASNIRVADRDKVVSTLKEMYLHLGSSIHGEASSPIAPLSLVPGGTALAEVSWFDPHGSLMHALSDPIIDIPEERQPSNSANPATKWAVEATGIVAATGLLTVTIHWLLAPRASKGGARRGLNVLLAGLCALAIVVFLRFGVLPRIKYGPARYWAILVVFWFLIFGVWASSTRTTRASP
ncbi:hypothetical protein L7F22_036000 [Adiantum nelumboides]|nr:hypothetical protein [Adiantum nelumboides]